VLHQTTGCGDKKPGTRLSGWMNGVVGVVYRERKSCNPAESESL